MAEIDYRFYADEDSYSDGDEIEARIMKYVSENPSEEYSSVIMDDPEFAVFYHLSDARQSLMNWYDFIPGSDILEIGAGLGALTGLLCEKCGQVFSVELTKRRAEIIRQRFQNKENLHIMVGDFTKMEFDRKFDYITVIGVLEHQSAISSEPDAHLSFLKKLKPLLKPNGKILIAIENRFGLKYWCGEVDDHTGIPFGSIRQNNYENCARTFDRATLQNMLKQAGFPFQKFFYPMPDYKFPRVIYSDNFLPKEDVHSCVLPIHYSNFYSYQPLVAEEEKLYHYISSNGVFPFFANSFFVEASECEDELSGIDFASVTVEREKKYRQIIRLNHSTFEKYAVSSAGKKHIRHMHENLLRLQERGYHIIDETLEDGCLRMPIVEYPTEEDLFLDWLKKGDCEAAMRQLDRHFQLIVESSDLLPNNEIHLPSQLKNEAESLNLGMILKDAYCDMILSNCFIVDGEPVFYDQEWCFDHLPAAFCMYRAINVVYTAYTWIDGVLPQSEVWKHFEIDEEKRNYFEKLQAVLFDDVQSRSICGRIGFLRQRDTSTIDRNIDLLMTGIRKIDDLSSRVNQLTQITEEQQTQIAGREEVIAEKDMQIAGREEVIAEKDMQIAGREEVIAEKDTQIAGRDKVITEKEAKIIEQERVINEKNVRISEQERVMTEKDTQIADREETIAEKDAQIAGREEIIAEKDAQIAGREEVIAEKDAQIAGREEVIAEKDAQIAGREEIIAEKDAQIAGQEKVISEKNTQIEAKEQIIVKQSEVISQKDCALDELKGLLEKANERADKYEEESDINKKIFEQAQNELMKYHGDTLKERLRVILRILKKE